MDTLDFFRILYRHKTEDDYICVFTLPAARARFVTEPQQAATHSLEQSTLGQSVYFTVGLLDRDLTSTRKRGTVDRICALPGFWLDLDIGGGHKKKGVFPSRDAVLKFLELNGLKPSLIVDSGHGFHCYFLFGELLRLKTRADQEYWGRVSAGFQGVVLAMAREQGFEIDMTGDLARILRVPGTMNRKSAPELMCEVVRYDKGFLYTPAQFSQWIGKAPLTFKGPQRKTVTMRADVIPDLDHHAAAAMINLTKFKSVFHREEGALGESSKGSDSEFDLSLASRMVALGSDDQGIADAMVASRGTFGATAEKLRRIDYMNRTLNRAHIQLKPGGGEDPGTVNMRDQADVLKELSAEIGIEIVRVVQYRGTNATYAIRTPRGEINIGRADALVNWGQFKARCVDVERKVIPRFKPAEWDEFMNKLLGVVDEEDTGEESWDDQWIRNAVTAYIVAARIVDHTPHQPQITEDVASVDPIVLAYKGYYAIHSPSVRKWLARQNIGEAPVLRDRFGVQLRKVGFSPTTVGIEKKRKKEGKTEPYSSTQELWIIPRPLMDSRLESKDDDEGAKATYENGLDDSGTETGED